MSSTETHPFDPLALPTASLEDRINKALAVAVAYGGIDGAHHKDWTIDQMVRALTGCPVVKDNLGTEHVIHQQGESAEYQGLIAQACAGEDGPNTYEWSTGIAP